MSQSIILKRSALPGKVPDTGSLNLGEVAVNTYDGKVFLKRSGSVESIETIVTTNSITTGSITLTQSGSFGELVVNQDANISRDLYVTRDIISNGSIDILGSISGSNALISGSVTAATFVGDGSGLTNLPSTDFDLSSAVLTTVDGNSMPNRSIADIFTQLAVNGYIDLDFNE
jgi:hypothetical protein